MPDIQKQVEDVFREVESAEKRKKMFSNIREAMKLNPDGILIIAAKRDGHSRVFSTLTYPIAIFELEMAKQLLVDDLNSKLREDDDEEEATE